MSKFSNFQSSLTFLSNLIGTKNHGVLKTLIKIQFHRTNLNLTNPNFWQIDKFSLQWDLTWLWMWTQFSTLWFSFKLWIYVDSVSLPNLDPISEPTLIPVLIDYEIESPIVDSHIPLMDQECELKFIDLDPTLELTRLSNLNLILTSQYWFPNLSFLSPNQSLH